MKIRRAGVALFYEEELTGIHDEANVAFRNCYAKPLESRHIYIYIEAYMKFI